MRFKLPARVQPQLWINDGAIDTGALIKFDAHQALLELDAATFRRAAGEIFRGGHDYDEIAIGAGIVDAWLKGSLENTICVTIDADDFGHWLHAVGLTDVDALVMSDDRLLELRTAAGFVAAPAMVP